MILSSIFITTDENQNNPWWMVDMGSSQCVGRVEIFNRVGTDCKYDKYPIETGVTIEDHKKIYISDANLLKI